MPPPMVARFAVEGSMRVLEAVRRRGAVQLRKHEAGLDARPALVGVDLEDSAHVRREVQDDRVVDRLAGRGRCRRRAARPARPASAATCRTCWTSASPAGKTTATGSIW